MTRYERQQVPAGEDFEVEGRVVEVLHQGRNTLTVLVEVADETTPAPATFEDDSKGVDVYEPGNPEPVDNIPDKATFYCIGTKADGSRCSREMDEPGERCFQHPEDDE